MDEKKIATEELIKQVTAASQVAAVEKEAARQSLKKKPKKPSFLTPLAKLRTGARQVRGFSRRGTAHEGSGPQGSQRSIPEAVFLNRQADQELVEALPAMEKAQTLSGLSVSFRLCPR